MAAGTGSPVEVGDRVFALRYAFLDQQIGLVVGDGEALVVDTRSVPSHAREILSDVARITALPVGLVVDTHWHWDHAFGNATFRPATIWGHVRTRTRLLEEGAARRDRLGARVPEIAAELPEVVIDPPDRTFDDAVSIAVGGRAVELRFLGRGHTDADIVVLVPDAEVMFAGDLLEEGATPAFGDAWPIDWPATVERLLPLATGAVVPGHGAVGDASFVREQLAALQANAELAVRVFRGDLGVGDAVRRSPWSPDTARFPVERAVAQLRGELPDPLSG